MAIYWPTPGLKGRTFKLCVVTRWDFNFCVRSSPLRVTHTHTHTKSHTTTETWTAYLDDSNRKTNRTVQNHQDHGILLTDAPHSPLATYGLEQDEARRPRAYNVTVQSWPNGASFTALNSRPTAPHERLTQRTTNFESSEHLFFSRTKRPLTRAGLSKTPTPC